MLGLTRTRWPFLCQLFHNQSQLSQQLQVTNNALENQVMDAQDDVSNAATRATLLGIQGHLELPTQRWTHIRLLPHIDTSAQSLV